MKTLEAFFADVNELKDHLECRNGKTVHTDTYLDSCVRPYSEWNNVKPNLTTFLDKKKIQTLDDNFTNLIEESRKSKPSVRDSKSYLDNIHEVYIYDLRHKIDETNIEVGFVNNLTDKVDKISEEKYAEYLNEAIRCVQVNAYRGAVVLGWQAAVFALYKELDAHSEPIHVAYQKKFGTLPDFDINTFWDFQKIQDKNILILAESAGIIDKSLKDVLKDEKNIRNKAAHPGKFDVGPNRVKAFLETIMELILALD